MRKIRTGYLVVFAVVMLVPVAYLLIGSLTGQVELQSMLAPGLGRGRGTRGGKHFSPISHLEVLCGSAF